MSSSKLVENERDWCQVTYRTVKKKIRKANTEVNPDIMQMTISHRPLRKRKVESHPVSIRPD